MDGRIGGGGCVKVVAVWELVGIDVSGAPGCWAACFG